jgi:hypothetical protein
MNSSAPQEIEFRPVEASDFPTFTAWLAEPHSADSTRRRPAYRCPIRNTITTSRTLIFLSSRQLYIY